MAQVYVCTNKFCREKGSDATLAAFTSLLPDSVPVIGVNCLGKCNRGPNVKFFTPDNTFVEATAVRSVDTVVQLLKSHLYVSETLRLNYEGNIYLRNGDVDLAIDCYNNALRMGDKDQEGVLLVMRGTALLQRAYIARLRYKDIMGFASLILPNTQNIDAVIETFRYSPFQSAFRPKVLLEMLLRLNGIFDNIETSPLWAEMKGKWPESEGSPVKSGEELLSKAVFSWSIYEHSLIGALQDLLTATLLLPGFAQAWKKTADALGEMWQFKAAKEYYDVALRLDESLEPILKEAVDRLQALETAVEDAEFRGLPREMIIALMDD